MILNLFGPPPEPMILFHQTQKGRVAKIRREGLKPHVPGKVWGVADPAITRRKPAVWLTADKLTWCHDKHPNKAYRHPDRVLLAILVDWNDPKLKHYLSWRFPRKNGERIDHCNNPAAWFVYFGTVKPAQIIAGLERPKRKPRR